LDEDADLVAVGLGNDGEQARRIVTGTSSKSGGRGNGGVRGVPNPWARVAVSKLSSNCQLARARGLLSRCGEYGRSRKGGRVDGANCAVERRRRKLDDE
jgi:hypothetical protein